MSSDHLKSSVFRAVLIVLMILGIPVIGFLVYLNIQQAKRKPVVIESESIDSESLQQPTSELDPTQ